MPDANKTTASFGFREVPEAEKEALVKGVFSSVARKYDLMNDLMSAGLHRIWKDLMVDMVDPRPGMAILDVAGGTGDIAFRMARRARRKGGEAGITVSDINADMLAEGEGRAKKNGEDGFCWVCADAEKLPFCNDAFDIYTIAFGIRNVTHIDRALSEARRVLKPGGRFVCLEFSQVDVPMLDKIYDAYSFAVLPRLGSMVAGDAEAYRYLAESIRKFPSRAKFAKLIGEAGLGRVTQRVLSGGIVTLHSAWRL